MKNILAGLALAFTVAGGAACGGSSKPATTAAAGPTCDDVVANIQKLMAEAGQKNGMDMTQFIAMTHDVVGERCTTDAWSAEAIACLANATADEMDACAKKLTAEQNRALEEQTKATVQGMSQDGDGMDGGGAGAPAPGSPPPPPSDPCGGDE